MAGHILVIDQGTTSTRAIVFDERAKSIVSAQTEFRQIYPHPGWIEHDPEDIWTTTLTTARQAIAAVGKLDELSRHAIRQRFETRFSATRMTNDYVDIYRTLIEAHHRDRAEPGLPHPGHQLASG